MNEQLQQHADNFNQSMTYAQALLDIVNELIEINSINDDDTLEVRFLKRVNLARIQQGLREMSIQFTEVK